MAAPKWTSPDWTHTVEGVEYEAEVRLLEELAEGAADQGFHVVPATEQEAELRANADLVLEREDGKRLLFSIRQKSITNKRIIDVDARPRSKHVELRPVRDAGWLVITDSRMELDQSLNEMGLRTLGRKMLDDPAW